MKHRHCPRSVCVLSELEYDAATKPRNIRVARASPLGDASVRACAVQIPGRVGDDSGHCVDPACATVNCAAGTACRGGICVDPCANAACPYGTQCELGTCVDPCAGVTCPADRVCSKGLCVSKCDCTPCDTGLTCAADGRCIDAACATVTCMSGTVCRMGTCSDPCMGVMCPGGGVCSSMTGTCSAPMSGSGGGGDAIGIDSGGAQGLNFMTGGSSGTTGATGMRRSLSGGPTAKGCGCRIAEVERERSSALGWLSAALGFGIWIRRQRSARRPDAMRCSRGRRAGLQRRNREVRVHA